MDKFDNLQFNKTQWNCQTDYGTEMLKYLVAMIAIEAPFIPSYGEEFQSLMSRAW